MKNLQIELVETLARRFSKWELETMLRDFSPDDWETIVDLAIGEIEKQEEEV